MLKRLITVTALAAALATPAFAQSANPSSQPPINSHPATSAQSATPASAQGSFLNAQNAGEWRSSKLVGANVYGADNKKIGDISDLLVDSGGAIRAAVIGVGGFLGVGEKNVAVPFSALTITRKADSIAIDKITVSYNKDELKNAPKFSWYQANGQARQTTGSATSGMSRPGTANGPSSSAPNATSGATPLSPAPSSNK